jgi:hypothetical protein
MRQELHSLMLLARAAECAHLDHLLVLIKPLGALLIFISGDMPASMPVDKRIIQLVTEMKIGQLLCNFHGKTAVQLVSLQLLKLPLMTEVWHSPVLLINWARYPLSDVHNPDIEVAVHVEVHTVHVQLQRSFILHSKKTLFI